MDLKEIENRLISVESRLPLLDERDKNLDNLLRDNVDALQTLNKSFNENKIAMVEISSSMQQITDKILTIESDVKILQSERSFNVMLWLKNNMVSLILLGGAIGIYFKGIL